MKNLRSAFNVTALVLVLRLGVPGAVAGDPKAAGRGGGFGPPTPTVGVVSPTKGDIGVYVSALGTVTPVYTVMVRARVDGELMTVHYQEGQMVRTNDPLVDLDPRPYAAMLTQAEGQLGRDLALLQNARIDLDRYLNAYKSNAIPEQQLTAQRYTVQQYEGTVKLDEGQVANARLQVTYSHITAPISGRVGLRLVDPGNIVHATDTNPLAVIAQLQPITVLFSVGEDWVPAILQQLRQGRSLVVDAYDRTDVTKIASGTVLTTDNQIDTSTATLRLKAIFTNEDFALFPNQFVNVKLLVSTKHDATLIPVTAIQHNGPSAFVYSVQADQTLAVRPVTIEVSDDVSAAVTGISLEDRIVADNFNRLEEGKKVEIRPETDGAHPPKGKPSDGTGGDGSRRKKKSAG